MGKRSGKDDSGRAPTVGLTKKGRGGKICTGLVPYAAPSISATLLAPLLQGKAVVLSVDDPRLPKRRRTAVPYLFLTPASMYGGASWGLVVAMQTHGCEVVDLRSKIGYMPFYRMGLSLTLSKAISHSLNDLFEGEAHGNTDTGAKPPRT